MEKPIFDLTQAANIPDTDLSEKLFSGRYRIIGNLSQWKAQNAARYDSARQVAQSNNAVGESPAQRAERHRREAVIHPKPEPFTPEVEAARAEFDEAMCRDLFLGGKSEQLAEKDPAAYRRAKLSAISRGVIGAENSFRVSDSAKRRTRLPEPEPTPEEFARAAEKEVAAAIEKAKENAEK